MTRRKPTRLGVQGNVANAVVGRDIAQTQTSSTETIRPGNRLNVILIMADQHRASALGAAGDPVAYTPNLDRLAGQSVRFSNAYCTNPVCAPSRASMLTGLYSHHLESSGNDQPFSPRRKTVAEHFSRADYLSALVGKMHFVDAQVHGFQYELGFDSWLSTIGPRAVLYADETLYPNSGAGLPDISSLWNGGDPWKGHRKDDGRLGPVAVGRASLLEEADHFETFVTRESIRFLENHGKGDEPFFLVSSFLKPHDPFMPAKRFAAMFNEKDMPLSPSWGKANHALLPKSVSHDIKTSSVTPELLEASASRQRIASYYGNLAQSDSCVGQILDTLTRLDLDRNTIVIYTSDHGEMLGDLGLWNKFQFYEGSCKVPLMFRVPGQTSAVCKNPVSLISLAATIGDLCSVPLPGPSYGCSFASLITCPSHTHEADAVFAEFGLGGPHEKYMIRDGKMKLSFWIHERAELYDLEDDPYEFRNLADLPEYSAVLQRLKKKLFAWYRPPGL